MPVRKGGTINWVRHDLQVESIGEVDVKGKGRLELFGVT